MVTQSELTILRQAKVANPHWFKAIMYCASIMSSRRRKYSGDKHSYFNFFDMAKRTGLLIQQVFLFFVNIKLSRLGVGSIEDIETLSVTRQDDGRKKMLVQFYATDEERSDAEFTDDPKKDSWADTINYAALALGQMLDALTQEHVDTYVPVNINEHPYEWPTLLLDFDGVLNMYNGWKGYFEHFDPRPGAAEFLRRLKEGGNCIVIHTVRPDIDATWAWLEEHDMKQYITDITNIKPAGVVLLDDRAITFTGDFDKAYADIRAFKAHWEPPAETYNREARSARFIRGLSILQEYESEYDFDAQHDVFYAGDTLPSAMTHGDRDELERCGWHWDTSLDCWYFFT
jgi:hypothetical protein